MSSSGKSLRSGWRKHADDMIPVLKRIPRYIKLARAILADKSSVDPKARRYLIAGLAYLLSPIDPIPGFIPVIGQLDDLLAALYSIRLALDSMPEADRNRVLTEAELTREVVEEDWQTTWRVTRAFVAGTGRAVWKASVWTASQVANGLSWAGGRVFAAADRLLSRSSRS